MQGLAQCNNTECLKKNECSRYTDVPSEDYVEFKNICNEETNYQWLDKK